jgi:hypothetical protein
VAARHAREALVASGWDAPVLARVVEVLDRRAEWLMELTAPTSPAARGS